MKVRPATKGDVAAITAIYNEAVDKTTGTFDTSHHSVESQQRWFDAHGATHPVLVAEEGGQVVGWASLSVYSERCAYSRTAELSVYVFQSASGKGIGGKLMDALLEAGKKAGVKEVIARIAEGNDVSLKLHFKRGFDEVGRLRKVGEKFGRLLDVHFLQKSLAVLLLALALPAAAGPSAEDALRESALRLAAGEVTQAREQALLATKADPRSARAWQQLAAASVAAQDAAGAKDAADRAIALSGESAALLVLRAQARGGLGDLEGALADTGRALRLSPHSARSRLERARVLEAMGKNDEALADYERAAAIDALLQEEFREARVRLSPPPAPRSTGTGGLFALLAFSALIGWLYARARGAPPLPERGPATLPPRRVARSPLGEKPLTPREALAALKALPQEGGPAEAHALALALHARLLDRENLPGCDAFFARALNADAEGRFRSPAELLNAFRALVDPAVL